MTIHIELDGLLEVKFTLTGEHKKLISIIHSRKNNFLNDPQIAPERVCAAFTWVKSEAERRGDFSKDDICFIHKKLGMSGEYRKRELEEIVVWNGTDVPYSPPDPENLPVIMSRFVNRCSDDIKARELLECIFCSC
jgi:hypothetical protein